ncbi:MAG: copper amine oxidase N-terminal domain-containing protein [Clostridia bacterium]|nr:copper amine oxidase N-terminal domain-containing protein [Clostridia bacterium]
MKRFLSGFLCATFLFAAMTMVFAADQSIKVKFNNIRIMIDGKFIDTGKAEPFIYNGYTYTPSRLVAEGLGATVKFNDTYNAVEIKTQNSEVMSMKTPDNVQIRSIDGKQYVRIPDFNSSYSNTIFEIKSLRGAAPDFAEKIVLIQYDYIPKNRYSNNDTPYKIILDNIPIAPIPNSGPFYIGLDYYLSSILPLVSK